MSTGLFFVRRVSTWLDASDFGVAPDDGVELALPGEVGEVHAELFEGRLLLVLRVRRALHVGHWWLPSSNLSLLRSTLTRRRVFRLRHVEFARSSR
jgi:hypothetical protein